MTNTERALLKKLADGDLDGCVGDEFVTGDHQNVYCGKYKKTVSLARTVRVKEEGTLMGEKMYIYPENAVSKNLRRMKRSSSFFRTTAFLLMTMK